jgi:uncharacterized protein
MPIYTFEHIIEEASVQVEDSTAKKKKGGKAEPETVQASTGSEDFRNMSLEELKVLLDEVVAQEDYMKAISIRNEIEARKKRK